MSEALSEQTLQEVRNYFAAFGGEGSYASLLLSEIDRLRAENKELREIVGEFWEYVSMDNVEHDEPMDTDYRDPSDGCSDRCRGCFREVIMDRMDKALEEK